MPFVFPKSVSIFYVNMLILNRKDTLHDIKPNKEEGERKGKREY